jgi:DNA-binding NarL/FixJ family response regulator
MIVDDFELVRKSLRSHLDQYDDLTVIGEASSGAQAVQLACALGPDVIVMDMHMPDLNGADATRQILKDQPDTVVIGLSVQTDPDIAKSMMDAGAAAFITKDSAVNELYVTLREAARRKRSSRPTTSRSPV